jgi:hypothetical protein
MQNFNDILNGVSDATKSISVSAVTVAGTSSLNGAVILGASSANDLTINGSLASSIPVKTNNSFDIGSSTLGLRKLYLGNGGAGATCDIVSASHATTREYTVPDCGAAASFVMTEVAQTINGAKTFGSGIVVGGNTTGDSNLGTISSVTNSKYYKATADLTFTGPFASGQVKTITYVFHGAVVTLRVPDLSASAATSATALATALPSALWPAAAQRVQLVQIENAGVVQAFAGWVQVGTDGVIAIRRDGLSTTWTGTGNNGWTGFSFTYVL